MQKLGFSTIVSIAKIIFCAIIFFVGFCTKHFFSEYSAIKTELAFEKKFSKQLIESQHENDRIEKDIARKSKDIDRRVNNTVAKLSERMHNLQNKSNVAKPAKGFDGKNATQLDGKDVKNILEIARDGDEAIVILTELQEWVSDNASKYAK